MAYRKTKEGAYFEEVGGDYKVVSDPAILKQLASGALSASAITSEELTKTAPTAPPPVTRPLEEELTDIEKAAVRGWDITEPTEEETAAKREAIRINMQDRIDAINAYFAELVGIEERKWGRLTGMEEESAKARAGSALARATRRGLIGSEAGEAMEEKTSQYNLARMAEIEESKAASLRTVEAEKKMQLESISQDIEDRHQDWLNAEKAKNQGDYEKYMAWQEKNEDKALAGIKGTASTGRMSLQTFKTTEQYRQLKAESGLTELEIDTEYENNLPRIKQSDYSEIQYQKNRNVWLKRIAFDPVTGQKVEYDYDLGLPYTAEEEIKVFEGLPYKAVKDETGKKVLRYEPVPGVTREETTTDKDFFSVIDKGKTELQQGESWGNVWNRIKAQFPNKSDAEIDNALGISWKEAGAYEKFKAKGKGGSTTSEEFFNSL